MHPNLQRKTISTAILGLACLLLAYFVVYPQWTTLSASRSKLAQAQAEQETLRQAETQVSNFLAEFNDLNDKKLIADDALPSKDIKLPAILGAIDELTKASGLAIGSVSVVEPQDKVASAPNTVDTVNLEVNVSGSFPAFKNFLLRLENHLRISDIENITLQMQEEGSITYQVKLKTYYQR